MQNHDNKMLIGIFVGTLYITFIIISLFVFISNKHPFFIKYKLKIGALILSLTGTIINGCDTSTSCYAPAIRPQESLIIDSIYVKDNVITFYKNMPTSLEGKIYNRECSMFYYTVVDFQNEIIEGAEIIPLDSIIDEAEEEFEIVFSDTIPIGEFTLHLNHFPGTTQSNTCQNYGNEYKLKVLE